jgi:hypothetical protein
MTSRFVFPVFVAGLLRVFAFSWLPFIAAAIYAMKRPTSIAYFFTL